MAVIYEAKNRISKQLMFNTVFKGNFTQCIYWIKIKNYKYDLVPDKFGVGTNLVKNMKNGLPNKQFHTPILKNEIHDVFLKKDQPLKK